MSNTLGNVFKTARLAAGLTQAAFAERIGVTRAAVGQWESGTHEPSTENLILACKALGIDVDAATSGQYKVKNSSIGGEGTVEKLSPVSGFKLMAGFQEKILGLSSANAQSYVPIYLCHTYPNTTQTYISQENFTQTRRPALLAERADIYALNMPDDSLFPRYKNNETIFIDPSVEIRADDFVIIRTGEFTKLTGEGGDEGGIGAERCYIGHLIGFDLFGIKLRHYQPARTLNVQLEHGGAVHRIVPYEEMIPFLR